MIAQQSGKVRFDWRAEGLGCEITLRVRRGDALDDSGCLQRRRRASFGQLTRTVPIVFPIIADPVGAGFVDSLARPGGNATGFMEFEYSMGGKWLELLKQVVPGMTRVAVLRDTQGSGAMQFAAIQAMAPSLRVEVTPVGLRDTGDIERAVSAFAHSPNGGLIVTAGAGTVRHSNLIITLRPGISCQRSTKTLLRRRRWSNLLWP